MKRLLVASAALALVGGIAPWNGEAGAAEPAHRLDVMIKKPGGSWVGAGDYGKPADQSVSSVLRTSPGKAVAVVRIVNTGSETASLDIWASSIRGAFYGGAKWPEKDELAPGEAVTFRYVGHRGDAEDGDSMAVEITAQKGKRVLDGVSFVLQAR